MAEGIVVGAVVTVIIETVIKYAKDAMICKRVCKKLQQELEQVLPDVRKIEKQMVELRGRQSSTKPPEVADTWIANLKEKLTEAEKVVHLCSSGSSASRFHLVENHSLTKKIQALHSDILKLAGSGVSRATLSSIISNHYDGSSHSGCCSSPGTSQYGSSHHGCSQHGSSHHGCSHHGSPHHGCSHHGSPHHGYGLSQSVDGPISAFESQGSLLHQKRMDEIHSILRAEEQTRLSMNQRRRHTIASSDFSKPAEQPVAHVHAETPDHFQQQQYVQNFQQPGHYYVPPHGSSQQQAGWFSASSHGHNVHHG